MLCLSHNFFLHEILVERKALLQKDMLEKSCGRVFFRQFFFENPPRKPMPPMGHLSPLKNNPLEKAQIATSNLAKILEKYVWRSSFLANLQACRLIAKLATLLTCKLLHRYFSTAFYPLPPFQSRPPHVSIQSPHVLNTCGKPWDICPLGRWEILLRGEFLCGGWNLRRSDFDHSNLF